MSVLISRHRVFVVYFLSLLWLLLTALLYSQLNSRALQPVFYVLSVIVATTIVYVFILNVISRIRPLWTTVLSRKPMPYLAPPIQNMLLLLVTIYGLVVLSHFLIIGYVPVLEAIKAKSDIAISIVRQQGYFDLPVFMRYLSDYATKAIGPALLLLTYYFRSRLFWLVVIIGTVYNIGLFARILPIILFMPILVYLLTQRRWTHFGGVSAMMVVSVVATTTLSSMTLRDASVLNDFQVNDHYNYNGNKNGNEGDWKHSSALDDFQVNDYYKENGSGSEGDWKHSSAVYALYERAIVVPGQVMYQWFDYYKDSDRRENGCGYQIIAKIIGCNYVHIPTKLYENFYRENFRNGMQGSLNSASFMTEYGNFGPIGFLLSSLIAGSVFVAVRVIYRDHPLALPMNLPLIIASMESSIFTAVNSGAGWLVMTGLFILFFGVDRK